MATNLIALEFHSTGIRVVVAQTQAKQLQVRAAFPIALSEDDNDERIGEKLKQALNANGCLLYTSPSPRDRTRSRMPSSA